MTTDGHTLTTPPSVQRTRTTPAEPMSNSIPVHLVRFPCMKPWVGCKLPGHDRRLAIVGESHYIPNGSSTLNVDPGDAWYASSDKQALPNEEHRRWMNTVKCISDYRDPDKSDHKTYKNIEKVLNKHCLCFDDVAFFNYVFRPVYEWAGGYSHRCFNIGPKDRKVSAEIMRWFICKYKPTHIVIASAIVAKWTCVEVVLREYRCLSSVVTYHPNYCDPNYSGYHFDEGVSLSLNEEKPSGEIVYHPKELESGGDRIPIEECKEIRELRCS